MFSPTRDKNLDLIVFLNACVCARTHAHTAYVQVSIEAGRGLCSPGARGASSCQLPDMDTGKLWTSRRAASALNCSVSISPASEYLKPGMMVYPSTLGGRSRKIAESLRPTCGM